jgi:hypothetical protein
VGAAREFHDYVTPSGERGLLGGVTLVQRRLHGREGPSELIFCPHFYL